ncbi:MAG: Ig-like domain-containing domain [Planctomycetota bacterium]|jgi:hypothetical protein
MKMQRCIRAFWITMVCTVLFSFPMGCEEEEEEGIPPLEVISVDPPDGSVSIPRNTVFTIEFSVPVDSHTIINTEQIVLLDIASCNVPASIWVEGRFVTIVPVTPLEENWHYGIAVRPGVRDIYGYNIIVPYSALFSTGPFPPTIPNTVWVFPTENSILSELDFHEEPP